MLQELVRATFLETQRLYPTVVVIPKYSTADTTVPTARGDKVFVPRWTDVFLDAVALHRHGKAFNQSLLPGRFPDTSRGTEEYWGKDCNEFRPDRFIDAPDGSYSWPRHAYIAFSAGHRACMGRQFATGALLREF